MTDVYWEYQKRPDDQVLSELVRRIVQALKPLRIILFGSAARGDMGPDSDLDILVVMSDGAHRRRSAQEAYKCLKGMDIAKDVVVATESDIREYSDNPSLVLYPALRHGKELYRAPG